MHFSLADPTVAWLSLVSKLAAVELGVVVGFQLVFSMWIAHLPRLICEGYGLRPRAS